MCRYRKSSKSFSSRFNWKDGKKAVRGKEANSSKNSNFEVNVEHLESAKSSDSSITSGSPAFNAANTVGDGQVVIKLVAIPHRVQSPPLTGYWVVLEF